jgi:hypothetical protein
MTAQVHVSFVLLAVELLGGSRRIASGMRLQQSLVKNIHSSFEMEEIFLFLFPPVKLSYFL